MWIILCVKILQCFGIDWWCLELWAICLPPSFVVQLFIINTHYSSVIYADKMDRVFWCYTSSLCNVRNTDHIETLFIQENSTWRLRNLLYNNPDPINEEVYKTHGQRKSTNSVERGSKYGLRLHSTFTWTTRRKKHTRNKIRYVLWIDYCLAVFFALHCNSF